MEDLTRRDLLKFGGITAAGIAGASLLASCSSESTSSTASESGTQAEGGTSGTAGSSGGALTETSGHTREGIPSFLEAPEAITDIAETKDYDVVIVGAGAAGIPAACAAIEAGVSVALIQKENKALSQGNTATGIIVEESDPAGVQAVAGKLLKEHQLRANRAQIDIWTQNSGEAVKWVFDTATAEGAQVADTTPKWTSTIQEVNGYKVSYLSIDFGPKPYNTGDGMVVLANYAEKQGVDIFYSTPAEQLVGDASSGVSGVIAQGENGYIQFNASKGVILATGDYQNDDEMVNYYLPDLKYMGRKQANKTGDGHKMGVWAGGAMEDITHTKMLHDFDAGPGSMADMPFLAVKNDGTRYCDETCGMSLMNCFLLSEEDEGQYNQIFDSNYMTAAADWPGKLFDEEAIKVYMPEEDVEKTGVYEGLVHTYKADTLEELAEKLGITDVEAFKASVERYNELSAKGQDDDFGKTGNYLTPIDTPPFYGIHRQVRISAIVSGLNVDENLQVTADGTNEPIKGLYACGNVAGNFYCGVDYTMWMPGLSLGRAHTQGRVLGKYVASL